MNIGNEQITREEIAQVYASQKINALHKRASELRSERNRLINDALIKIRTATETYLKDDIRYISLVNLVADLKGINIRFSYNIVVMKETWTVTDEVLLGKGSLISQLTVNVLVGYSNKSNNLTITLFDSCLEGKEKLSLIGIKELSAINDIDNELKVIDQERQVDWKSKYHETLIAAALSDKFAEIGDVRLPDIKLLNL